MPFKIKDSLQVGTKSVTDISGNLLAPNIIGDGRVQAAATQDAIILAGRAGGTSSFATTFTPITLTANRTITIPDKSGTIALISDISVSESDTLSTVTNSSRGVGYNTTATALSFTNNTTSTTTGTGALVVTGGVGIGENLNVGGYISITSGVIKTPAAVSLSIDSGLGAIAIGAGVGAKTIIIGNATSTTGITMFSGSYGITSNLVAGGIFKIVANAPPTTDIVQITNVGQPTVTSGASSLQITYVGGAAAVEASASRIDFTPGTTSGGIWNAFRVVTTAATTGVIANAFKADNKTVGLGISNIIYAGTGWDNIINYNGTSIINGTGGASFTTLAVSGDTTLTGDLAVNGGDITSTSATFNLLNSLTTALNIGNSVPTINIGNTTTTTISIGSATGTTTVNNNLSIVGNLTVTGITTTVNSTVVTFTDPIITLGGNTSQVEVTKDRGIEYKWNGTSLTITNFIGNGTTTVTGTVASTTDYSAGDIITISGATGTEQIKLNGTWTIVSVPNSTTFTFTVTSVVAAGTLSTTLGTTVKVKNGFFGLDQSTGKFTFIPQSNNVSEVFSGTAGTFVGNIFESTVTTGTAPLTVASTTVVTNLNADMLDGLHSSSFLTSQSNDFGTFAIGTDSGYTWGSVGVNTNQIAEATSDTLTFVRGTTGSTYGIDLFTNTIAGIDAIKISHSDTSTLSGAYGTNGISSITVDVMGHVTAVSTATYLTSYSETDTLSSVTGRGATTSTVSSFTGGLKAYGVTNTLSNGTTALSYTNVVQTIIATVTATPVDTWAIATYRACKYIVQITQGANVCQISEVMVIHNGTTTQITEYAAIETSGTLATFTSDIVTTNARLIVTMIGAASATINIHAVYMVI